MTDKAILYQIINKAKGLRYIGVTTGTLSSRFAVHLYKLRRGKAPEKLQQAFDIYGEEYFAISEIASGSLEAMLLQEKLLTQETVINGYNTIIGGGDIDERRRSRKVLSEMLAADPEYRANFGRKISEKNKGHVCSAESRKKMSENRRGIKLTDDQINARREYYAKHGNNRTNRFTIYLNTKTGVFYETPELLSLLGISKSTLLKWVKARDKRITDFISTHNAK